MSKLLSWPGHFVQIVEKERRKPGCVNPHISNFLGHCKLQPSPGLVFGAVLSGAGAIVLVGFELYWLVVWPGLTW